MARARISELTWAARTSTTMDSICALVHSMRPSWASTIEAATRAVGSREGDEMG
jgi:hypothetical protein